MARINLFGNTARAVEVARSLYGQELAIVTSPEQNEEPLYIGDLFPYIKRAYTVECDVLLAVNWREMIDVKTLAAAKYGAFCLHDSLLPAYRGSSPVVWAVEERASEFGVTMFRMNDQVDGGPIIGQRRIKEEAYDWQLPLAERVKKTWGRLTPLYVDLVRAHLPAILNGTVVEYPQDPSTLQPIRKRREWPK